MKTIIILSHVGFDDSPYCSFVHEHAKALVKEGYKVVVFAILGWFPFVSIIKKKRKKHYNDKKGIKIIDGVTVIYKKRLSFSNLFSNSKINLNGISYYLSVKGKFKKIVKQEDIFFIDAHTFKVEGYVASILSKKTNIHAVVTCHGTSFRRTADGKNSQYTISKIMKNLDYAICVSDSIERKFKEFNVFNTKVIYNGIKFYPIENNDGNRDIDIITVGHLIKQKNIDIVIEVFNSIIKKCKNARLVIIGSGKEEGYLKELTNNLGIAQNVKFEGDISNEQVQRLMSRSRIFLLPSVNEGFGIVYLEAMHNGCITIATKGEGIDGFIRDGQNGFLVRPNLEDIVKKVTYILDNEKEMSNIFENGIKDTETLSWEHNAKKYIKIFDEEENIIC